MHRAPYAASVRDFYADTRPERIDALAQRLYRKEFPIGRRDSGEIGSWIASLPALADVLHDAGLERLWIALEYQPYQAGRSRADAVVAGLGHDGRPAYLVVELKQWERAGWNAALEQVRDAGTAYDVVRHPFDQASAYAQFIRNFTSGMHEPAETVIDAAAFLHNATESSIATLRAAGRRRGNGTFSGDVQGRRRFRERLERIFDADQSGLRAMDRLADAHYHQGPDLLEAAAVVFRDPELFPLTDQQYGIFGHIQNAVSAGLSVSADRNHAVIVVKGGPGTGKTWIAMHLLGANADAGRQVTYATNSVPLRTALRRKADFRWLGDRRPTGQLVTSARTYWDEVDWEHPHDLLIVDEAHRLEEYTVRRGHRNPRELQARLETSKTTQLFELNKSARVLVLFIDEDQASAYRDHVTIDDARLVAERTGASFKVFELTEQHRSGGSQAYEEWVDALVDGQPIVWHDEEAFSVRVAQSPRELERAVMDDAEQDEARLLAGFCWEWQKFPKSAKSIEDVPFDIDIDGWKKRWNLHAAIDGYPDHSGWAHNPRGADQVGSVFTAQGFEFQRCGVIIGGDLTWHEEPGRMEVDITASRYKDLVRLVKQHPEEAARVRNQYRVLLTRAMRRVVLYSTDPDTLKMLNSIVNPA
ncbi:DUF2075 domain-containing protein [Actinoplanes sp. TBRC 11911]|uniref:DNA/RNA helicase domain-containing protein n=1 Tax=Actinoplanes sp. TBRC 11911 TaxID=2729386 RepID=UPI00145D67B2|nr:DNA/RNA helicase domain-containing protein [Actinoplanes sp. TBRC 11911]NMO57586.1 DUF2075 domain-containing protein [Actinoplanes sp. TBRC 11911]